MQHHQSRITCHYICTPPPPDKSPTMPLLCPLSYHWMYSVGFVLFCTNSSLCNHTMHAHRSIVLLFLQGGGDHCCCSQLWNYVPVFCTIIEPLIQPFLLRVVLPLLLFCLLAIGYWYILLPISLLSIYCNTTDTPQILVKFPSLILTWHQSRRNVSVPCRHQLLP